MSYGTHLTFSNPATSLSQAQVPPSPSTPTQNRGCCENGRPVLTDPHTGQSVCSCQYSSALLGYSRLSGLSSALFPTGTYTTGAAAQGYGVSIGAENSAFYSPLTAGGTNLRDSNEAWRSLAQSSLYDTSGMGFYPYGSYGGLDLNARRKNATRESTNTLKAWLHEHIKNPYPTKGEKIMLAIITKMTLTQVSTWFANARRRLKKENKMTWSPRNRSEDGDDDDDDDADDDKTGVDEDEEKERRLKSDNQRDENIDVENSHTSLAVHDGRKPSSKSQNAIDQDSVSPVPSIGEDSRSRLSPPQSRDSDSSFNIEGHTPSDFDSDQQKPKIWSVTDFLLPGSNKSSRLESKSCRETGPKMDTMRCVPSASPLSESAVDLTGRTVGTAHATSHTHATAFSGRTANFFPTMTSLPAAQQLSTYQSALASYAAQSAYSSYAFASAEMNKLVMRPTATRFNPYHTPKQLNGVESAYPPPRDFTVVREGE